MASKRKAEATFIEDRCDSKKAAVDRLGNNQGHEYHGLVIRDSAQVHAGDIYNVGETESHSKEYRCLQVFKTATYEEYKDRNPFRVLGTCEWVLNHRQFQNWRHHRHERLLWISADPGCGKSVLARSLADFDLQSEGPATVCYFFFKDNKEQDNLAAALCALLHQLFTQRPRLISHAVPQWEKNGTKLQNETQEMFRILQQLATEPSDHPIICILDALDECRDSDRKQLITFLSEFQEKSIGNEHGTALKFLVTSRPYDNVQRWFEPTVTNCPHIRLRGEEENDDIRKEINLVIDKRTENLACEFGLSNSTRDMLRQQLIEMEHRTYLWLYLAIDEIRDAYRNSLIPDDVVIESLPSSVGDAYERILQKISEKQKPNAQSVLTIIVGARRPLTIKEMASALSAANAHRRKSSSLVSINENHLANQIRHWCGLFVFLQNSKVYLIHQTAKEFLLASSDIYHPDIGRWQSCLNSTNVEQDMAKLCTMYLCLSRPNARNTGSQKRYEDYINQQSKQIELYEEVCGDSFFLYCAQYWTTHLQDNMINNDSELLNRALLLYDHNSDLFDSWALHFWDTNVPMAVFPPTQGQHVIVFNGHVNVLDHFYKRSMFGLTARDWWKQTSFERATQSGHPNIVKWFLDNGVDVKSGEDGCLVEASEHDHREVIQMLLAAGAEVNVRGGAALSLASKRGHDQVVRLLLAAGADVNVHGCDALPQAAAMGHAEVIKMLLAAGADINVRSEAWGYALVTASKYGYDKIVQLLLEAGANARSMQMAASLSEASKYLRGRVVRLLLAAGADVNFQPE